MRSVVLTVFCVLAIFYGRAQVNLVPNPSFEIYTMCPSTLDELYLSNGWSSYSISPDYYNSCNGSNGVGVPSNGVGYQNAASGVAYAGFQAYDINGFAREIIGRQLSQTLTIGQKYYASIKVSIAEFFGSTPQYLPCNKIGVKFSTIAYSVSNPVPINNFAHVYTNTIISDTLNWTTINGSFIADSSYQYVMVGNFFDDSQTDTTNMPNGIKSYFFVDDVCISTDSLMCDGFSGVMEPPKMPYLKTFPNPANSFLLVEYNINEECVVIVYNIKGEELYRRSFTNNLIIDISNFSEGVYFLNVQSNKVNVTNKLMITHK